jgi:hypothetical protein
VAKRKTSSLPRNIVVINDIHAGCRMGLSPLTVKLDGGGDYLASDFQSYLWARWREFWTDWVPHVTKGEPYDLCINGDVVDGVHHGSTTQISHNLGDQAEIAMTLLRPIVKNAERYFHIRGTEAHVGPSGVEEERIARELGATPDANGNYARWDMLHEITGPDGKPRYVHFTHHISPHSSGQSEVGALGRELNDMYNESGRWGKAPADVLVRGHRHRYSQIPMVGDRGLQICVVSPGWQGKTPFTYRLSGARMALPQFGGIVVRAGDEGLYVRAKVWTIEEQAV